MTPIKRRKRQKFVYCFSHAKILCHHYYIIVFWHSVMMTINFCMRKYNKRIFAFSTFIWCHLYTIVKTTVFYIKICCFIITVLSGHHSITQARKPLLDERISKISCTCWVIAYFVSNFVTGVSRGRIYLSSFNCHPKKTPARCKDLGDISYTHWVIVYFVTNVVAMATGVGRGASNLSDIIQ